MPEISLLFLIALGKLSEEEREIVVDRVVVGLSLATIAARYGVSNEAIRQRERKALQALSGHLIALGYVR